MHIRFTDHFAAQLLYELTNEDNTDNDDGAAERLAQHLGYGEVVQEATDTIPLGLSKWAIARLQDSRESGEIDTDVPDAVIEREAAKLEVLIFQLASSFVDNEFNEKETI